VEGLAQMTNQATLGRSVHAIGIGVHSGQKVRIALRPAEENTGVVFVRVDCDVVVHARAALVSDTTLATTIAENGVSVATIEHLMAALWGTGIDNVRVELTGEELPALDGSSAPFVELIRGAGLIRQSAPRTYLKVTKSISVEKDGARASLHPFAGFAAEYTFVADHPVYNQYPKHVALDFSEAEFERDLSFARSFGLVQELPAAQQLGRCLGSSLDNAVGIDERGILNTDGLRSDDEFARHKLLDAIGDLYLLGYPLVGRFEGLKSGHTLNNQLIRLLLDSSDAYELVPAPEVFTPADLVEKHSYLGSVTPGD
jgi:UDP-3-O-[3-hydroxymyristoyl] N-acetylglucosamine deacetylase